MARKQHKPEEIVAKLRQVEVLAAQGEAVSEAVRAVGVTEQTYATSCCGRRSSTRSAK
jgi:hypothetical protein